ncbi:GCN5-related protein N-acetyltransferase [Cellulomonas flavigena DSM 20109]|uniref:GCN5-related protein N-acetyltransferase n=1 Tax=Cellulomonas flavigena (strain ATCC 482 / DSM 20109 / BCRC 11376 / JCM 18109 / NBRC 3775 / NCIMB 8073 / NRS 134) TaxID=446466 RepID=D5UCG0_CELFN|nr:GNAT family N-acetyltransferase [Cellulomonas flavigena]ADG74274.1 GCN5-related protein N-acetyltransferase [Cellulomonas flavigena DSM 20109]
MSTLPAGYRTVAVPSDRVMDYRHVDELAFATTSDPEIDAVAPFPVPTDRLMAVEGPDGAYVAVHGSYEFRMPVPGGAVPCAGLTWVGVRPDHRRRGLLTSMIGTHVERSLGRGEPVSALFAAEAGIYGRFGYGSASDEVRLTLRRRAALRPVAGSDALTVRVRRATPEDVALAAELDARAAAGRPGWMPRATPPLQARMVADPPAWRNGGEPLVIVTVHDGDDVRGLALFRRKEAWGDGGAEYTAAVRQASAVDAAATHRLWSFLLDLDLTTSVETPALPVDDALLQLLVDLRPTRRRVGDNLWVRVLDLPAALTARRYARPADLVLDVTDALLPANAGRWRLTVDATGTAEVSRTDAAADVALDVRELGALYLGGRSARALATAGLAAGAPAELDRLTATFVSPLAPVCPWIF